ncbi:MAG: 4-(cytidine 5'-diphospho)-2-C-methyl-D-erythritol kinase [Inquilinaceae bacterium]
MTAAPAAVRPLSMDAPAKLNLYLHVIGRRADGYHDVDGLVAFASVGDRLTLVPASSSSFTVDGAFAGAVPVGGDNLVIRALDRAAATFARPPTVALHLTKTLPVAAGIGGGSADAAALLRLLARYWRIGLDDPRWSEIALSLGADVPVCLSGLTGFIGGVGEKIDPGPVLTGIAVVLANPCVPVATPAVFAALDGRRSGPARFAEPSPGAAALAAVLSERGNDLEPAAMGLVPDIASVRDALAATDGCLLSRMSGSGATCFALYDHDVAAETAAKTLTAAHPDWWVRAARLL